MVVDLLLPLLQQQHLEEECHYPEVPEVYLLPEVLLVVLPEVLLVVLPEVLLVVLPEEVLREEVREVREVFPHFLVEQEHQQEVPEAVVVVVPPEVLVVVHAVRLLCQEEVDLEVDQEEVDLEVEEVDREEVEEEDREEVEEEDHEADLVEKNLDQNQNL